MGDSRFDSTEWAKYATKSNYASKSTAEIFTKREIDPGLDPKGVTRESCDSAANPNSQALIWAGDQTGSMNFLADAIIRTGFPTLAKELYARKPGGWDPHICAIGVGDCESDRAPLQVTQFEADAVALITQVEKIYLEKNGGGNSYESYTLPWLFAAQRTKIDCFRKRGKKGLLFTVGDENPPPFLYERYVTPVFGERMFEGEKISIQDLYTMVSREWDVFHLVAAEGSFARGWGDKVIGAWQEILGQNAVVLADHTKMAEVIVSMIQVHEGVDHDTVAKSWDGSTSLVVGKAIKSMTRGAAESASGVVSL